MFSLDKFHSKHGLFGGSSGGDGGAASTAAIKEGTQQGLDSLQKYYQDAVPALKTGASSAQGYLGPYAVAGSTALDELYDTLGMARPTVGTEYLSQALQNEKALQDKMTGSPASDTWAADPNWHQAASGWLREDLPSDGAQGYNGFAYNPEQGSLRRDSDANGNRNATWAETGDRYNPQTGQIEKETKTQSAPGTLTAAEQKQWDAIQQYKGGTLSMQTADPNSILSKLQNTPGYQFLLKQGLQSVDRSASAQGLLGSGAAIKGAQDYGSGLAEQTYNTRVQQLAQQAGLGSQMATQQGGVAAGLGTGLANAALGMGSNTASLYGSQAAGLAQVGAGQAAAQGQSSSGLLGAIGSIGGAFLGNPSLFSDARLKDNIKFVGTMDNGLRVYDFNYVWDYDTTHRGVMAQEVEEIIPEAVETFLGAKMVDYSKLGVK